MLAATGAHGALAGSIRDGVVVSAPSARSKHDDKPSLSHTVLRGARSEEQEEEDEEEAPRTPPRHPHLF